MTIDIEVVGRYYEITEDGMVFSRLRGRWLKPTVNNYGYIHYCLTYGLDRPTWVFAHTLVALKYLGAPPSEKHEIDHLDENKSNNHYMNLMWRTHAENVLMSYARGRRGAWVGRSKPSPGVETRILMANAKKKPVIFSGDWGETRFESMGDASVGIGVDRRTVYRGIKEKRMVHGGYLRFLRDDE